MSFEAAIATAGGNDTVLAKSIVIVAEGDALAWYSMLRPKSVHYYRLIYHYRHFHCHSDRSDRVILPPLVEMIAMPLGNETGNLDFYHRLVNIRCDSGIGVAFALSHVKLG